MASRLHFLLHICLVIAIFANIAHTQCSDCYTHSQALAILASAGITVRSSGNCSNRNNPRCTSLDLIRKKSIADVITLKRASGCAVTVTGGTETGHSADHSNGWKLDVAMSSCLTTYITRNFRSTSATVYCAASGNKYFNEGNHWDINYRSGNGC